MSGFSSPNHTQVPNDLFDTMLPLMGNAELRIVLHAIRQTLGFHRGSDAISVTQFMKATGLSRQGVLDGIASAVERGVMEVITTGKRGLRTYRLVYLLDRSSQQTGTGLPTRPVDAATGLPTRPTKEREEKKKAKESVSPAKVPTPKRTPNVIPFAEESKRGKKEYDRVERAIRVGIINAWTVNLPAPAFKPLKQDKNHETAADLHEEGYTEEQVAACTRQKMAETYWKDKTLTLQKVAELLPGWLATSKKAQVSEAKILELKQRQTDEYGDPDEWTRGGTSDGTA